MTTINFRIDELPLILNMMQSIIVYSATPRREDCEKDVQLVYIEWDKSRPKIEIAYKPSFTKRLRYKLSQSDYHWVEDALRDALLSSGILLPTNYPRVLLALKNYTKPPSKSDPRIKAVAIDTNILYNMFLTTLEEDGIEPYKLLVSTCVLQEIARAANNPAVDKMSYTPEGSRLRRAWGAHYEWLRFKEKAEKIGDEKCRGDETIISHYSQLLGDYDPILLTFDDKSLSHATARGLPNIYIETPGLPPNGTVIETSHPRIQRLIYSLALVYGAIRLRSMKNKREETCIRVKSFDKASQGKISVIFDETSSLGREISRITLYRKIDEILRETIAPS